MLELGQAILRSIIAYLLLLAISRIVGRKAISQMTFFDYTVAITLGTLTGTVAVGKEATSLHAGISIVVFGLMAILTSLLLLRSLSLEKIVESVPVVVIDNGEVVKANLNRLRMTVSMLETLLREKNAFNIADVDYAVMEIDGKLSVLLKSAKQPATPSDLNIIVPFKGLTIQVIIDGNVIVQNLNLAGKTEEWLTGELNARGIKSAKDVFYAVIDSSGVLYATVGGRPGNATAHYGLHP